MSAPARPPRDWAAYYAKTGERPPRDTLLFALDRFDDEGGDDGPRLAVDLGAGGGRDTVELLRRGWRVLALDAAPQSAIAIRNRTDLPDDAKLETQTARFEDADWPECDLVNSSFALPICAPDDFPRVWAHIVDSLKPGGRFAGQFYGDRDSWAGQRENVTFYTRTELDERLTGLEVEMLDEEEDDSTTPRGETKHWHIFHIVVRKPD
jgi:tellurite methyltransferase